VVTQYHIECRDPVARDRTFHCFDRRNTGLSQQTMAAGHRSVTGSAPSGGSDFVARTQADKLSERVGYTVIVDNRPGADRTLGADVVAKANPDGYRRLLNTGSAIVVKPALQTLPYDVKRDFTPALPAKRVADVMWLAKAHPQKYSYASSGIGAMSHLALELFKNMADVNVVHVPYRGGAPATGTGRGWSIALQRVIRGADRGGKRLAGIRGGAMVWQRCCRRTCRAASPCIYVRKSARRCNYPSSVRD
jgi:Tripartite tricarboxylate transporter family receptor